MYSSTRNRVREALVLLSSTMKVFYMIAVKVVAVDANMRRLGNGYGR